MSVDHCDHVFKNKALVLRGLYLKALNGKGTQKDYQDFVLLFVRF
jgi:hypothetical protein